MKTFSKLLLIFLSGFFLECHSRSISMNESLASDEIWKKYREGDVEAYYSLQEYFRLECVPGMFIDKAKYFADTIQYKPANLDVFEEYLFKYNINEEAVDMSKMTKIDKKDAIRYLTKAREYKLEGVEKYNYVPSFKQ